MKMLKSIWSWSSIWKWSSIWSWSTTVFELLKMVNYLMLIKSFCVFFLLVKLLCARFCHCDSISKHSTFRSWVDQQSSKWNHLQERLLWRKRNFLSSRLITFQWLFISLINFFRFYEISHFVQIYHSRFWKVLIYNL